MAHGKDEIAENRLTYSNVKVSNTVAMVMYLYIAHILLWGEIERQADRVFQSYI